jgi:cell division topological specificity factor
MAFFDYFRKRKKTAEIAKDRLQIIVARERSTTRNAPWYLPELQQELLHVIAKYEQIDVEAVSVNLDRNGDCEVLELNIVLPEEELAKAANDGSRPAAHAVTLGRAL